MLHCRTLIFALILASGLGWFQSSAVAQVRITPVEGLSASDIEFDTQKLKQMKGVDRVFVPRVTVSFITRSAMDESTGRALSKLTLRSAMQLTGVDQDTFQRIVDQTHADFRSALTEAGFDVVPVEEMKADPAWAELRIEEEQHSGEEVRLSSIWDSMSKISGGTHAREFVPSGEAYLRPGFVPRKNNFFRYSDIGKSLGAVALELNLVFEFVQYRTDKSVSFDGPGLGTELSIESRPFVYPSYVFVFIAHPNKKMSTMQHDDPEKIKAIPASWALSTTESGSSWKTGRRKDANHYYDIVADPVQYEAAVLSNARVYIQRIAQMLANP